MVALEFPGIYLPVPQHGSWQAGKPAPRNRLLTSDYCSDIERRLITRCTLSSSPACLPIMIL